MKEEPDFDAWACDTCCGDGWYWKDEVVSHLLGTDLMPFKHECEDCDGLGYCGPDAQLKHNYERLNS